MKIDLQERKEAKLLLPILNINWRKTLLSLENGVVYKVKCFGMDYPKIISASSSIRRSNLADFVINTDKTGWIYICKIAK